jgi:spore maturation protein CgeB
MCLNDPISDCPESRNYCDRMHAHSSDQSSIETDEAYDTDITSTTSPLPDTTKLCQTFFEHASTPKPIASGFCEEVDSSTATQRNDIG